MDRREDHVPRLRRFQRRVDGLQVAHLADHDDVRILAQGGVERVGEGGRIRADLALRDDALVVCEHEFDGVLDRDDLRLADLVDLFDHGRECGGLAHASGARDQHVATPELGKVAQHVGQIQLVECADLQGNDAEHDVEEAALSRNVDAEAALVRELVGQVELVERHLVLADLALDEELRNGRGVVRGQDFVTELHELAVEPIER
jgi:hypothetical protein